MASQSDTRVALGAHPTNLPQTHSGTFDPAAWLVGFEAVGGGYAVTDGHLHLFIAAGTRQPIKCSASLLLEQLTGEECAELQRYLETNHAPSEALSGGSPNSAGREAVPSHSVTEGTETMNMMSTIQPATVSDFPDQEFALAALCKTGWAKAKADWAEAKQREDSYDNSVWRPAYEREAAFLKEIGVDRALGLMDAYPEKFIPSEVEDEMERLLELRCQAEETLIVTPALTLADVIWKIEYTRERWKDFEDWPADWWDAIMSDLRHLASSGSGDDPVSRYWAAFHAFNADRFDEGAYMEAFEDLHDYTPATDRDFVRKFEAAFAHGGAPNGDRIEQLIGEASTLLGADSRIKPPSETIDATTPVAADMVGPDLTKAEPIAEVIARLAPLRNGYSRDFLGACTASGMDIMVIRDRGGVDQLQFGIPCDSQEKLRVERLDALAGQMKRGKTRRQQVIDHLNLIGRFLDNQPFPSVAALADAYLERGGHLWIKPDGQVGEPWLPFERDTAARESWDGYPLRRLVHRYSATLLQPGAADAIATYVREHGKHDQGSGCYVLRAEVQADA